MARSGDFTFVDKAASKPTKTDARVDEEVVSFLRGLPQGEEDWDNNKPETEEELLRLREGLTLSVSLYGAGRYSAKERAEWPWDKFLENYAQQMANVLPVDGPERQMYDFVFTALCCIGVKVYYMEMRQVDKIMRTILGDSENMLHKKRMGVCKYIEMLNVLDSYLMGERAHEIPMRRAYPFFPGLGVGKLINKQAKLGSTGPRASPRGTSWSSSTTSRGCAKTPGSSPTCRARCSPRATCASSTSSSRRAAASCARCPSR